MLDEPFTHVSAVQAEMFKDVVRKCTRVKDIIVPMEALKLIKNSGDLIRYEYINHII